MKILKVIETNKAAYHIRTPIPADKNFITHSWVKNFYAAFAKLNAGIGKKNFNENQYMLIRDILEKESAIILIACDQFNPDIIFGYLVAELAPQRVYVHWVYIKDKLRSYGLAKALFATLKEHLPEEKFIVTHLTSYATRFVNKNKLRYEPLLWDWKRHEQGFNETSKRALRKTDLPGGKPI